MIKILIRIYYFFRNRIKCALYPNKYAMDLGVILGKNVKFYSMKPGMFSTEPWLIKIGNNCHITDNCTFITHDGGTLILRDIVPDLEITEPIIIGDNVYIGVNTTILMGSIIGDHSIVGACSLVKGVFPSNSVIGGVPAKVICSVDEYLERAKKKSLHLGHLKGTEKEKELKKYYEKRDWGIHK